jgi:hypothetical protein
MMPPQRLIHCRALDIPAAGQIMPGAEVLGRKAERQKSYSVIMAGWQIAAFLQEVFTIYQRKHPVGIGYKRAPSPLPLKIWNASV